MLAYSLSPNCHSNVSLLWFLSTPLSSILVIQLDTRTKSSYLIDAPVKEKSFLAYSLPGVLRSRYRLQAQNGGTPHFYRRKKRPEDSMNGCILVVDDEPLWREQLVEILNNEGY